MRLINSQVLTVKENKAANLEEVYKDIEEAARTCYKSESKGDPKAFVNMLIKNKHMAMLEHGTVYLQVPWKGTICEKCNQLFPNHILDFYCQDPFSTINFFGGHIYVTTNYRVILENSLEEDLEYQVAPTEHHIKRYTAVIQCSRACAQQITRHRAFSFAMESQRYCNYSKDKFGKEITFIKPEWYKGDENESPINMSERLFYLSCNEAEGAYFDLLKEGRSPQEARVILPNATKTELVMTGFKDDWEHFISLRALDSTGKADAEVHKLALAISALLPMDNLQV